MDHSGDRERAIFREVERFQHDMTKLSDEVGQVIVGNTAAVETVITCLLSGGHGLLEGVPGIGKTMLVRTIAECVQLSFSRIQFTPDLMPADIVGTMVIAEDDKGHKRFEFQRGPIFANIVLADEINRATPKTQSALLEAMQEQRVTVSCTSHVLEPPFLVLATQNPLEMEGTYPLPEAQLDRFLFKLRLDYPDRDELHEIVNRTTTNVQPRATAVLAKERLLAMRRLLLEVPVAPSVQDFAIRLVLATHPDRPATPKPVQRYVRYGASPRGAQALLLGAKVKALLDGRFAVATEDIRSVALPALRHRIILSFEGEAQGIATDQIIDELLQSVSEQPE